MNTSLPMLSNRDHIQQFLILISCWFICFGAFELVSSLAVIFKLGNQGLQLGDLATIAGKNPALVTALKYLQLMSSIGAFAVPAIVFSYLKVGNFFRYLTIDKKPSINYLILAGMIVTVSVPLVFVVLYFNQKIGLPDFMSGLEQKLRDIEEKNEALLEAFIIMKGTKDLIFNLIVMAIVPAFCEELFFRGALQKFLGEWMQKPHVAIILSGMIFSFFHFQFSGFFPRWLLGILFGYLFYWSGNLWYPIFAHFIYNGLQVFLSFLFQMGAIETNIDKLDMLPWHITLMATVVLIFMLNLFKRGRIMKL